MDIDNMTLQDVEARLSELDALVERSQKVGEVESATVEKKQLLERKAELEEYAERKRVAKAIQSGGVDYKVIDTRGDDKPMSNTNEAIGLLQRYVVDGGTRNMNDTERRALDISGSAAVLPIEIMNKLITETKYSDLLHRATVINEYNIGTIQIPIASNTSASWKLENSDVDGDSNSYEATPTLTKLDLRGYELYRWGRVSAAAMSRSASEFERMLLQLLADEVVEALEDSFIGGSGTGQPKGLDNLTWVPDTNQILTASAVTAIGPEDIAEALSLLPQKYARNAIVLCNADMLFNISKFKGTAEYAYNLADGATRFLGKEIVVSEHVADDTVYIVDPKELYVRFASPMQLEANRSSGFTAAAVDLRALCVVDAAWNPAACVAVGLGAGGI